MEMYASCPHIVLSSQTVRTKLQETLKPTYLFNPYNVDFLLTFSFPRYF